MEIYLANATSNRFKVDFICEVAVPTTELYILTFKPNLKRWIINDGNRPDRQTDTHSEYHLAKIQHIIYGHIYHNEKKITGRLACFIRRYGAANFDNVFFPTNFEDIAYRTSSAFFDEEKHYVIDFVDYNRTRKLLGQSEMSLAEYISRRVSEKVEDEFGLSLDDETSLFSVDPLKLDPNNCMTTKGMRVYIEEQNK